MFTLVSTAGDWGSGWCQEGGEAGIPISTVEGCPLGLSSQTPWVGTNKTSGEALRQKNPDNWCLEAASVHRSYPSQLELK